MFCIMSFLFIWSSLMMGNDQILKDLNLMYQNILENHPGPYNEQDLGFMQSMNDAYQEAKKNSVDVHTKDEHIALLQKFAQSFCDRHLRVSVKQHSLFSESTRLPQIFSITSFTDDVTWITIPNFSPTTTEKLLLESLINQISFLQNKKYIVLDLRGNSGGSSLWGTRILESLFTKDYVQQQLYARYKGWSQKWRVSQGNINFLIDLISWMEKMWGKNSKAMSDHLILIKNMQKSLELEQIYFSEIIVPETVIQKSQDLINPVNSKIIVLIDRFCASSCVIFINELEAVTTIFRLIGQTTAANTSYMEVRDLVLSDDIYLMFPMAIEQNPQGPRTQFYVPNITYPDYVQDQNSIQAWVEEIIKNITI